MTLHFLVRRDALQTSTREHHASVAASRRVARAWIIAATVGVSACSSGTSPPVSENPGPPQPTSVNPTPNVSPVGPEGSATVSPTPNPTVTPGPTPDLPTSPIPAGNWTDKLTLGPNGPIPVIVVDQFGYRPADPKFAILRDPRQGYDEAVEFSPGESVYLVDATTNAVVKTGAPTAWKDGRVEERSGDAAWTFDFSDVTAPGRYFVFDPKSELRSPEFEIAENIYAAVLRHAFRTFYYQRAGFEKKAEFAGEDWADGASHVGPGQDAEARAWVDQSNADTAKDLSGGWYDAGDYNKYTTWHARYIVNLLRAFAFYPDAFGDDFGIPESGNGTPDVLDEVRFGIDWLRRMQNDDGSVLCILGLGTGSPPSSVTEPSYYGPATTAATLSGALAFAYSARILSARDEEWAGVLASELRERAARAWQWADANPDVTYFNNDESKQEGSSGLAAGQQEVDDDGRLALKVEAAVYLFQQTNETAYREFIDANWEKVTPNYLSHWQVDRHEAALDYAAHADATPAVASAIRTQFSGLFLGGSGLLQASLTNEDPYRSVIDTYTWGSNQSKAAAGRILLLNGEYSIDPDSVANSNAAAADYIHYIHGVNPLGLVYLTNMGGAGAEHSAKTLYHTWFSHTSERWSEVSDTTPGPAPGFLVGGPNPMYEVDACCTDDSECYGSVDFEFCALPLSPPLDQPMAKAYLQFNHGWPANSWAVTENSNGYQTQYLRLLAAFVK